MLYKELNGRKSKGENLDFDSLTPEELTRLYIDEQRTDNEIAELFDVKKSKVTYKRKKYGITIRNAVLNELLHGSSENAKQANIEAKEQIFLSENIDMISKAVTHFVFRNGPVEDMHANGQLSQDDMKVLNKFMVNRLAYIFQLIIEDRWIEFEFLVKTVGSMSGTDWDRAEPDDGGIREMIEIMLKDRNK